MKLFVLSVLCLLVSGCSAWVYPAAVLSNFLAGMSQGGLSDLDGLVRGALINGFFNIVGVLPPP
jgi:hypothetical protein